MQVEKLSGTFGARISDLSLANINEEDFGKVAQALWEHQVLVFKEQLTVKQQPANQRTLTIIDTATSVKP